MPGRPDAISISGQSTPRSECAPRLHGRCKALRDATIHCRSDELDPSSSSMADLAQAGLAGEALDVAIGQAAHVGADDERLERSGPDDRSGIRMIELTKRSREPRTWGMAIVSSPSAVWIRRGR